MTTGKQIRAARAFLEWDAEDLATLTKLTRETIFNIERGTVQARSTTLEKIVRAFNDNGVEFIGDHGVQWIQHKVQTFVGTEGLKIFFIDVRAVSKTTEEEIVICGFAEDYFEKKLGDFIDSQRKEMAALNTVRMRCLIEEGDPNVGASEYCQYRWQPKENFSNVPFYVYGNKVAIVATSAPESPLILLIDNASIAQAYRRQFGAMWDAAINIPKRQAKK